MEISQESRALMAAMQQGEATEALIYRRIAARVRDDHNRAVLLRIAEEEAAHAQRCLLYTSRCV